MSKLAPRVKPGRFIQAEVQGHSDHACPCLGDTKDMGMGGMDEPAPRPATRPGIA